MKQLEVRLRVRNNLLVARRLEMGFKTQTAVARAMGLSPMSYNGFECLRTSPLSTRGGWNATAQKIAAFHCVSPSELWPDSVLGIKQPVLTIYADPAELMAGAERLALPADTVADVHELHDTIMAVLNKLKPRDREMMMLYFGITDAGTTCQELSYKEIGLRFGVCSGRVQQIVSRVLSDLRRGGDRKTLVAWHDEPPEIADYEEVS